MDFHLFIIEEKDESKMCRSTLILTNCNIITLEDDGYIQNGHIKIYQDKICEVSHTPYKGDKNDNVIDLQGATVLPGFIDSHNHLASTGRIQSYVNLGDTKSIDEAIELIRQRVKNTEKGQWVYGWNWDESKWVEKRYLTKDDLDAISTEHPIYLVRVCGHLVSVNSLALEKLNLDLDHPGVIKENGEPIGVLKDIVVGFEGVEHTDEDTMKGILVGCRIANELGITTNTDNLRDYQIRPYIKLAREGKLTVRMNINIPVEKFEHAKELGLTSGIGGDFLRISGVKIFTDGSIGAKTAAISYDYIDDPDNHGIFTIEKDELLRVFKDANSIGMQTATHAIGDRAIDMVLECWKSIAQEQDIKPLMHRIEHAELIRDDQLELCKELGIVLSMQPNFMGEWGFPGEMYDQRLGHEITKIMNPFKKVIQKGIKLCFGSDGMPLGPLYGIWSAVNCPYEDCKISVIDALKAYTIWGAEVIGQQDKVGTIKEGKYADLVVLEENPLEVPEQHIKDIKVLYTIVGGKIVFKR